MDKTALKNFAVSARKKLIEAVTQKAYEAGISKEMTCDVETFEGGFRVKGRENGKTFKKYEVKQRQVLLQKIAEKGFDQVMEEVAYTWFNRFIALRFMEINNYLPTEVRVLSSLQPEKTEPDIIQKALEIDLDLDKDIVFRLQDNGDREDLYKYLLIKQCNQLGEIMPAVFEQIEDYTELLLPDNLLAEGSVLRDLVDDIEEYDWKIELTAEEKLLEEEKGEHGIEIIGWLYQYYISEKKDEVFAGLRKNIKITKENIPAATQLFTPKWIVKYMVENSLGRLWLEKISGGKAVDSGQWTVDSGGKTVGSGQPVEESKKLKSKWKYYLDEAEQEPEVEEQLKKIRAETSKLELEDIKLLDPAMGSGHILVYAFDLLYDIYLSQGYPERQIPKLILEKNLYGLEIDERAGQLASFALLMKARSKNRRIFREPSRLNLCAIQESNFLTASGGQLKIDSGEMADSGRETVASEQLTVGRKELIGYFVQGIVEDKQAGLKADLEYLLDIFYDAKVFGSILNVKEIDFDALEKRLSEIEKDTPHDVLELKYREILLEKIPPLLRQGRIMSRKYDVVCTNPPYMGRRGMNSKLSGFLNENFPDTKNDLFAVFMELDNFYLKCDGFMGMISQQSWMFLSSYQKLREKIIKNRVLYNMVHLGPHAFEGIGGEVVQSTVFVLRKNELTYYKGCYLRLVDLRNSREKEDRVLGSIENPDADYRYISCASDFLKIPGSLIAYWVHKIDLFSMKSLGDYYFSGGRSKTHNNEKYVRFYWEVDSGKRKWVPYANGGEFRKYFGNEEHVVDWSDEAKAFYHSHGGLSNCKYWNKEGITWSLVSPQNPGFKIKRSLFQYSSGSPTIFNNSFLCDYKILGFLNSCVSRYFLSILNPTLNNIVTDVLNLPYDKGLFPEGINGIVSNNIDISQIDWNFFETSRDFPKPPLLTHKNNAATIEAVFQNWSDFAEAQFNQLKKNEEELNRIFIDIYGLQDELTPEVEDKDVTVSKADRERDIKSFISYAVGCMFGRYSLNHDGLIYAGGEFDEKFQLQNGAWEINAGDGWNQSSVPIAKDNIIPITDGDYFEDGMLERFVDFLKVSFGVDTLEKNLNYIAESLGQRATETPRQAIRRYFLRDFYRDHVRIYKKRPIYWLFNSGRENGFKALIYMHRYDPLTVARVRTDYLHPLQKKYEAEMNHLDILLDSDLSSREKAVARKQKEVIRKRLQECLLYDQAIAHVANQQIAIDLDDGVKVNYAKFQGVEIPLGKGKEPLKADLLAKI